MMRALSAAALVVVLLAGGCGSTAKLTGAVTGFGTVTSGAVKVQKTQLQNFAADQTRRMEAQLATDSTLLTYSAGCTILVETLRGAEDCFVTDRFGKPVVTTYDVEHVLALGAALDLYAQELVQLAGDNGKEADAFSASLTSLANAVAALDGAAAKTFKSKPATSPPQLTAVANVVATVGNLYFQHQRTVALRKIIVSSQPIVEGAISTLVEADDALRGYDLATEFAEMVRLRGDLALAIAAKAGPDAIGAKQKSFLAKFERLKGRAAMQSSFSELAKTHENLAIAAASGASVEDILAYMKSLTSAAASVAQSLETLRS
jgi:hypothetical protein